MSPKVIGLGSVAGPFRAVASGLIVVLLAAACGGRPIPSAQAIASASAAVSPSPTASRPTRTETRGEVPVLVGTPIDVGTLTGKIVFDDFEDVFTMNADGSGLRTVAGRPGSEFDGAWSPDGGPSSIATPAGGSTWTMRSTSSPQTAPSPQT